MNTDSVDCRRIHGDHFPEGMLQPGDFMWSAEATDGTRTLYFVLPGRDRGPDAISVRRGAPGGSRVWGWDGNEDKPTLTPSIHVIGQWHGYLTAGRLVSC